MPDLRPSGGAIVELGDQRVVPIRWRRLVGALTSLREANDLDLQQAADLSGFSKSKISRIETYHVQVTGDDAYRLAVDTYGAPPEVGNQLAQLARAARNRGWWHTHSDTVIGGASTVIQLEEDAASKWIFESAVVPGNLQTEDTATAIFRGLALDKLDDATVRERVRIRMQRKEHLLARDVELWVVLDEAVLFKPYGGHAVAADQMDHLAELQERPNVTIQVIPKEGIGNPASGNPFSLITLTDETQYVYQDQLVGGAYTDEDGTVSAHRQAWEKLTDRKLGETLTVETSTALIRQYSEHHRSNSS